MKKLGKLSALLVLSLIIPGYVKATNNNEKENSPSTNTISYSNIAQNSSLPTLSSATETSKMKLLERASKDHYSLYVGYTANIKNSGRDVEEDNKYNNIIELGAAYTKQLPSKFGYSIYVGSDIMFNSSDFWVGPKVGGNINYSLVMIGSEMIMYTDARLARAFYRPYVGVGVGPLKITGGYNIGLANKGTFNDINSFTVGLTIPLFWGN